MISPFKRQRVINVVIILVAFIILGSTALASIHYLIEVAGKNLIEIVVALLFVLVLYLPSGF